MHYFVYLDEFGHIGPFIDKKDPKHNTSPIFGLGGLALPVSSVRDFGMYFYKLKEQLLDYDLKISQVHPSQFEEIALKSHETPWLFSFPIVPTPWEHPFRKT